MSVTIRRFTEADREAAGTLLAAAFPDKLAAMLGDRRALRCVLAGGPAGVSYGPALYADLLPAAREPVSWVAVDGDGLATASGLSDRRYRLADGLGARAAGLTTAAGRPHATAAAPDVVGYLQVREGAEHGTWREHWPAFRRHLGVWRSLRASLFFLIIHSARVAPDELLIETVAVHPRAQGLGTGGELVSFALAEGRRRGKKAVILYCIDRNVRARDVYLRTGFRVDRLERLWWLRWLLGFSGSYLMRARLDADQWSPGEAASGARIDFS